MQCLRVAFVLTSKEVNSIITKCFRRSRSTNTISFCWQRLTSLQNALLWLRLKWSEFLWKWTRRRSTKNIQRGIPYTERMSSEEKESSDKPSSMPLSKVFKKCKSATFQIDGQTYTIGNDFRLHFFWLMLTTKKLFKHRDAKEFYCSEAQQPCASINYLRNLLKLCPSDQRRRNVARNLTRFWCFKACIGIFHYVHNEVQKQLH